MRHRRIEPNELRHHLKIEKLTYAEIAALYPPMTVSGVKQAARRAGLTKKQLSHKEALPWTLAEAHQLSKVATYLRKLSSLAQGKQLPEEEKNTILPWAQRLVDAGLDIDYDREAEPNDESVSGGFYTKPADQKDWHLKKVLDKAKAGTLRRL